MSTPKKPDEYELWRSFGQGDEPFRYPAEAAEALGIPFNRMRYLCLKWARAGIYEYGTWFGHGWKAEYSRLFPDRFRDYWLGKQ